MPAPPSPRPPFQQTRSSGWAWPHLVDKKEQQERTSYRTVNTNTGRQQLSAASSLRNLQSFRDLPSLREEQSTPTSPTQMPSTPSDSMSDHRAETSGNGKAVDGQPNSVDVEHKNEPVPEESGHRLEGQHGQHDKDVENQQADETTGEDAVHPDDNLPGTFPLTPAAAHSVGESFPGLAQAGLLPAPEETDTVPDLSHQFPGLAQVGLLPASGRSSAAVEPHCTSKGPLDQACVQNRNNADRMHVPGPCDCGDLCQCPAPSDGQEPEPMTEKPTAQPAAVVAPSKKDRRVVITEPKKPLPPPAITIQRPSNSDISDISEVDEDESSTQPIKSPNPRTIDSVLAEERRGSRDSPMQQRLEEERLITSKLTQADRERIIQDIATDMAAAPPPIEQIGDPVPSLEVKKRMKVRRALVRGPMLKLILGRQLAGPAKQALKLSALGKAVPATEVSAIPTTVVDGGLSQSNESG